MNIELRNAILEQSAANGYDPVDVATLMSYETAGTFDDWKRGPITQHGQHRGLIQWGAPQRRRYGVYKGMPVKDQVKASMAYLKDAGAKPGMGLLDLYSAVNAGKVGRYNRTDENNGGAPGTVRDKVENQMSGHRQKALALLGGDFQAQPAVQAVNSMAEGEMPPTGPTAPDGTPVTLAGMNDLPEGFELDTAPVEAPTDKPLYQVQTPSQKTPFIPDLPEGFELDQPDQAATAELQALSDLTRAGRNDLAGEAQVPGMPVMQPSWLDSNGDGEFTPFADSSNKSGAFMDGLASGIPIIGPALTGGMNRLSAGVASALSSDLDYGEALSEVEKMKAKRADDYSAASTAGHITGNVGSFLAGGATALGAKALGVTGPNLLARGAASATSGTAIAGADTLARGGSGEDAKQSAIIGGAIGGAVPFVGAGIRAGIGAVANKVSPHIRGITNPNKQAALSAGKAIESDRLVNQNLLSPADEASAAANGQNVLNVDRGGESTRGLLRSATNTNPEARAIVNKVAGDRFADQSGRGMSFIDRVMSGKTDDLAYQDALKAGAQTTNNAAYKIAEKAPAAQSMWTPELQSLAQSPSFRAAMKGAEKRGADRAAVEGTEAIRNPFREVDGKLELIDGVTPNLRYWDQVQRNLNGEIGVAQRSGDKTKAADLIGLKKKLLTILDDAVPEFKTARAGAAAFFGADDALDAGRKAVMMQKQFPELQRAHAKFSPSEKELAAIGFASSLKDSVNASAQNKNLVINQIWNSPEAKQKITLFLGKERATELEAFLRVETAMDRLRGAMGNSTTAQQLVAMGAIGGGVGAYQTGDLKQSAAYGLAAMALKGGKIKADQRVMKRIAEILMSGDANELKQAVRLATKTPTGMNAVKALEAQIMKIAPAAAVGATQTEKP